MESSRPCKNCGQRTLVTDHETGNMVCTSCAVVQDFDNFQAYFGGISGPSGTYVRLGTSGAGTVYTYKETKIYQAQKVIEDIMFRLGLSGGKTREVKVMVETITEGEYGQGKWFPVFIGACAYVVMRKDNKTVPISEVADFVGCDIYEMGRMVNRVVEFLELKLPEFDIVNSLERAIGNCPSFSGVAEDLVGRMLKQGVFIVQCLVKWFFTTGRRPMPVVAAVLVFVASLNHVDVKIDDLAKELHVAVPTCKVRYKELLERFVEVAQVLPWGKDITVKNILQNAHYVIQYMELKSMTRRREKRQNHDFSLEELIEHCLTKDISYGYDSSAVEKDSEYFKLMPSSNCSSIVPSELHISEECLAMVYSKVLEEASAVKSSTLAIGVNNNRRKRDRGFDLVACTDWWQGKSELSKKLMLKQILEKDVGLDAMPPSFDKNCQVYEMRRERIKAAKLRIQRTMNPSYADCKDLCLLEAAGGGKKKRKAQVDIDWEDFIIETLLLHRVKEEEIEKGHYKVLLDLYVFADRNLS